MEKLPVISSTLFPYHIGLLLSARYGLDPSLSCTLLKTGVNHSYLVEHLTSKFIFRVYSRNWRTDLEVNEEIRLLDLLKAKDISISFPIKDVHNEYIQYLEAPEGVRQGLLFSFAEGEKQLNFSAAVHFSIGETMAKIHQATLNMVLKRVTYTPEVILKDSLLHLQRFLPPDCEEMAWMASAQEYLLDQIVKADHKQLRSGSVHLDIWFDNLNITKDGKVTIFDFDFCGNGWLCYDIAYYILQLHSTEKNISERDHKARNFLNGYESVTPISAEEKRMLPILGVSLYFFYLGVQCQRYENWSNVFLNEIHLKRFINLLIRKYFEENIGIDLLN